MQAAAVRKLREAPRQPAGSQLGSRRRRGAARRPAGAPGGAGGDGRHVGERDHDQGAGGGHREEAHGPVECATLQGGSRGFGGSKGLRGGHGEEIQWAS